MDEEKVRNEMTKVTAIWLESVTSLSDHLHRGIAEVDVEAREKNAIYKYQNDPIFHAHVETLVSKIINIL